MSGYPTEQEYAEAFGVESEESSIGTDAGGEDGAETTTAPAETPQEAPKESEEEPGTETGEESREGVQSAEERHRQAAARRARERAQEKAQEEQARKDAAQLSRDRIYADFFEGQLNPFTGKPIQTEADYQAYRDEKIRRESEQKFQQAGLDPGMIENMIEQRLVPMKQQLEMAQMQQMQERARMVNARAQEALAASMKTISSLDPSVKSLEDIAKMPTAGKFNDLVQKGIGIEDAFYLANRKEIEKRKVDAAAAAGRSSASNRSHLDPASTVGKTLADVPAEMANGYRELFPDATDAEIAKEYQKFLQETGR